MPAAALASGAAAPQPGGLALLLALLAVFLFLAAICSAAEISVFSLTQLHLDHARTTRRRKLTHLRALMADPKPALLVILSGRLLFQIAAVLTLLAIMCRLMPGAPLHAAWLAALTGTALLLVCVEIIPKAAAMDSSLHFASRLARPVLAVVRVTRPVWRALIATMEAAFRTPQRRAEFVADFLSQAELKALTERGDVEGLLEERERNTIDAVLEFNSSTVEEIMVPRRSVEALSDNLGQDQLLAALRGTRHSRLPLYHETVDNIVGVVHAKEILANPDRPWRDFIREPLFVPEKCPLTQLLLEFQLRRMHLALVVDEYGGTSGVVALDDLLREIISAFEEGEGSGALRRIGDNRWLVRGDCEVFDLNETLEADLPDAMSRTVGGFLTAKLGRFPRLQESVTHEQLTFTVLRRDAQRVQLIRVTRRADADEADDTHPAGAAAPEETP
jgi:putative hemolysin